MTICYSFTELPCRLRHHRDLHLPRCSALASHRSLLNLPRTALTIQFITTIPKAKPRSSTLRLCLQHMGQIRRWKPSITMLSVLLSLVLAHGPLVKIVRTVASAERRTVGSDCQRSHQSAARRSQWSFIWRRLVRHLAALIAGSKLARQLGPPKQVCQDLGSPVPVGLADKTVRRVSSLRPSAASLRYQRSVKNTATVILHCTLR
jgi:hypothetical protein